MSMSVLSTSPKQQASSSSFLMAATVITLILSQMQQPANGTNFTCPGTCYVQTGTSLSGLGTFPAGVTCICYPELEHFTGSISLGSITTLELALFPKLSTVSGAVTVQSNTALQTLDLSSITSIGLNIDIYSNALLSSLGTAPAFGNLVTVGGVFLVWDTLVPGVLDLSKLTTLNGYVNIKSNANFTAVNLSNVPSITGYVDIESNSALTAVDLRSVSTIGGHLYVHANPVLHTLDVSSLTTSGSIIIYGNAALQTLDLCSLTSLTTSGSEISSNGSPFICSGKGLAFDPNGDSCGPPCPTSALPTPATNAGSTPQPTPAPTPGKTAVPPTPAPPSPAPPTPEQTPIPTTPLPTAPTTTGTIAPTMTTTSPPPSMTTMVPPTPAPTPSTKYVYTCPNYWTNNPKCDVCPTQFDEATGCNRCAMPRTDLPHCYLASHVIGNVSLVDTAACTELPTLFESREVVVQLKKALAADLRAQILEPQAVMNQCLGDAAELNTTLTVSVLSVGLLENSGGQSYFQSYFDVTLKNQTEKSAREATICLSNAFATFYSNHANDSTSSFPQAAKIIAKHSQSAAICFSNPSGFGFTGKSSAADGCAIAPLQCIGQGAARNTDDGGGVSLKWILIILGIVLFIILMIPVVLFFKRRRCYARLPSSDPRSLSAKRHHRRFRTDADEELREMSKARGPADVMPESGGNEAPLLQLGGKVGNTPTSGAPSTNLVAPLATMATTAPSATGASGPRPARHTFLREWSAPLAPTTTGEAMAVRGRGGSTVSRNPVSSTPTFDNVLDDEAVDNSKVPTFDDVSSDDQL